MPRAATQPIDQACVFGPILRVFSSSQSVPRSMPLIFCEAICSRCVLKTPGGLVAWEQTSFICES
jgi:hypothetical protein